VSAYVIAEATVPDEGSRRHHGSQVQPASREFSGLVIALGRGKYSSVSPRSTAA
jgi:hypothetical protein